MRVHYRPRCVRDASVYLLSGSEQGTGDPARPFILPHQPASLLLHMSRFSCKTAARPRPAAHRRLGSPLQQDMCYWLQEREIRLEKGAHSLSLSIFVSFRLGILSSSLSPFQLIFPPLSRTFLCFSAPRGCSFSAEHLVMFPSEGQAEPRVIQLHDHWALRAANNARLRPSECCFLFSGDQKIRSRI